MSHSGPEHVDLATWPERVEAVLNQPANRQQASQRPPRPNHVEVRVASVASDDIFEVLLASERQRGEIEKGVTRPCLRPVDNAYDDVTVDEDVGTLQVAMHEYRGKRPERGLGNLAIARNNIGRKDVSRDEPLAFTVEVRCGALVAFGGPWWQRCVVERPYGGASRCPRR